MSDHNNDTTAELYNARFLKYGRDIQTVGWGDSSTQRLRFDLLFRGLDPTGKTILDVGCGLGDLVPYLNEKTSGDFQYYGIDIAESLLSSASEVYRDIHINFLHTDLFSMPDVNADISVLSGALSFKTKGIEQYAFQMMEKMFDVSNEGISMNFLTKNVDYETDKNQHYAPGEMVSKASELSRNFNLFHDYPLYEFTIQVLR